MSIEAKQLTTNTWFIKDSGFVIGMIYLEHDKYVSITKTSCSEYDTFKEAKAFYGKRVKEILAESFESIDEKAISDISGFPVKHDNITIKEEGTRPIYQRVNSVYVAGYWTVKYSEVWVSAFCPLLSTIESYPSNGPYKTELEMKSKIASNNKLGI